MVIESCCPDRGYIGKFLQCFTADVFRESPVDMTVTEVFLNLFQFRSEFCFVSYAEYNVQDLSMLEKFSRFFNVGRNLDAAVRYQKIRQFFLHFSTCSIYIQHWNYDSIFPGNAFDKRNRFL